MTAKARDIFRLKKTERMGILILKKSGHSAKKREAGKNGMKRFFLIYSLTLLVAFVLLLCGTSTRAATETTVEEIVAGKDFYDGKEVSVIGAVSTPRFRASRHRKPYLTFPLLGDSGGRINILFWGDIKLKTGKKIKVRGIYKQVMELGKYSLRDVIEASQIEVAETSK